jgi:hypothetical protein
MVREHAAPQVGASDGHPVDPLILVLPGKTAACKMEQKKDTIISDE